MALKRERFGAGTTIPSSGIYAAVHVGHAKGDHEVTCLRGGKFPPCRDCGSKVEFVLVRRATHVKRDGLFSGTAAERAST